MSPSTRKVSAALIKGSWEATVNDRARFFLFVVLYVCAYSLDLLVPWAIGYTLKAFVDGGASPEAFHQASLGILASVLLRMGNLTLHHTARYFQAGVGYNAKMNMITRLFGAMMRYPLRWHISTHSGDNLSKLHRAEGAVLNVVGTYIWQMIEGTVKVFGAAIAIFALDVYAAGAVILMALMTVGVMVFFNRKLTSKIRLNNKFGNKVNRICVDYLVNVVTVKTLNLENQASRYLQDQQPEGFEITRKIAKYMELKWAAIGVGQGIVSGLVLYIFFWNTSRGEHKGDIQQVYVLLTYLDRIFQAIGSFTGYWSGLVEAATAYEDANEIFENSLPAVSERAPQLASDSNWKSLNVKNLNFSYVEGERAGLHEIELSISRGEKIALVGQSGSGKSTFLKVLAGLLEPDSYSISTDEQVAMNVDQVTRQCLLIPQEPEIFSETVKYNLTMGDDYDSRELSFFVSLCKLDRVMQRLPQGLDSDLAEKGLNMSVGEKQRVAMARGLLRAVERNVILLDEPTSSLDPKTEKEIFLGLLYHFADKTVLSACHRLNLVPLFDKILLFEQGRILEIGTFAELIERRSHFARAWDDFQSKVGKSESLAEPS